MPSTAIDVPERPIAIVVGLALVVLIAVIDLLMGSGLQITGLFTCPPFVTAVFVNPRRTAIVGVASVLANVALAQDAGSLFMASQLIRMSGVVLAAIGAVALTVVREREQSRALTLAHIAEVAQLAVLRVMPPRIGPADLAVRYVSASAQARVGGDFYEALHTEVGLRAIVGDVRGKGLGSVQLANVLIGAFRGADHDRLSLEAVAIGLDAAFTRFEPSDEDFATAVLVELTVGGELTVVNCGHPAPLVIGPNEVEEIRPPSYALPLGLGARPTPTHLRLGPEDRLLMFTDGIIEARRSGVMFDLVAHAPDLRSGPLDDALERLVDTLRAYLGTGIDDDVALLLLEPHRR